MENIGDLVLSQTMKVMDNVSEYISKEYKGVKPFDKKKIDNRELIYALDHASPEYMQSKIQEYGPDVVNEFIYEVEMARSRLKTT